MKGDNPPKGPFASAKRLRPAVRPPGPKVISGEIRFLTSDLALAEEMLVSLTISHEPWGEATFGIPTLGPSNPEVKGPDRWDWCSGG